MYYEMYPISHFISERQKKFQPSNRKAFRIKKNIWQAVGVLTMPRGTQLEVSRDNRSINKLPSMSPTTELEENSKLCNLKEQKKSKGQPGGSHGQALGSLGGSTALQSHREKHGSRNSSSPEPHCAMLLPVLWATIKIPHFLSLELIHYQKCSINGGADEMD